MTHSLRWLGRALLFRILFISTAGGTDRFRQRQDLDENHHHTTVTRCLERVAIDSFVWNKFVLLVSDHDTLNDEMLKRWTPRFTFSLISVSVRMNFTGLRNVVIVEDDPVTLLDIFTGMKSKHSACQYVVVIDAAEDLLEELTAKIWHMDFLDVIFLKPRSNDSTVVVYGFDVPTGVRNSIKLVVLDHWRDGEGFAAGRQLFPLKMKNMMGYPLKIITIFGPTSAPDTFKIEKDGRYYIYGVYANMLNLFCETFNFSLVVVIEAPLFFNTSFASGVMNVMNTVAAKEVDVSFGGFVPTMDKYRRVAFSNYYGFEVLTFTMKPRYRGISWRNILMPLSADVWKCSGLTLLAFAALLLAIRRLRRSSPTMESLELFDLWRICIFQNAVQPKRCTMRIFFFALVFFSYILASAYTSLLVSILSKPYSANNLDTFEELRRSDMIIEGSETVASFLDDPEDPSLYELYKRIKFLNLKNIDSLVVPDNAVWIGPKMSILFHNWKNRANPSQQIYMLQQKIVSFPSMFFTKKGHPVLKTLDRFIGFVHNSGLVMKWSSDYGATTMQRVERQDVPVVLSLTNLGGVFFVLLLGLLVSFLQLLLELYHYRSSKRSGRLDGSVVVARET